MAVKLGVWSLTLLPGEKYPIYVRKDFQITNASLGEELRSETGRSVVKVTYEPLPPNFFNDEIDSDEDSEDDEEQDEFELDEEEGFKKVNGDSKTAAEKLLEAAQDAEDEEDEDFEGDEMDEDEEDDDEEEDDEDEDDDEDDEDEDDSDDDEMLETSVLCALSAGRIEQATLNLTFTEGEVIMLEVTGENAVHLMGNYIDQFPDEDSEDEFDSDDEHDDYSDLYDDEDLELDLEDDDEPIKGRLTEIDEAPAAKKADKPKSKPAAESKPVAASTNKRKADAIESPAAKSSAPAPAAAAATASTDGLTKTQKKKLAKKARLSEGGESVASAAEKKPEAKKDVQGGKGQKRTLPSGLVIEDVKIGDGPAAKPGKRLSMRYIGKLTNGKQFDANTAGSPFSFVLGRGEVIKGWDEGLKGMHVGGERKLEIPANLAYGKQNLPGIPKNSTLNFEVKLLAIK